MSLPTRLLLCATLVGGCGLDGPSAAVRVVADGTVTGVTPDRGGSNDGGGVDGDGADSSDDSVGATDGVAGRRPGRDEPASNGTGAADGGTDVPIVPPFPTTVAVVGDSLTLSARDEITVELAGLGLDVLVVDGVESRRMTAGSTGRPSGLDAIDTIRDEFDDPDLWVIALGTNDVGAEVDEGRFRADVRAALAGVGADTPVVWVDLWIRDRTGAVVAANRVIRDELAGHGAPSGVAGWFAHGADDGMVTDDGVHLTDRGQHAFANAIANRVRSIYRR